jgi:hypothetical protein
MQYCFSAALAVAQATQRLLLHTNSAYTKHTRVYAHIHMYAHAYMNMQYTAG